MVDAVAAMETSLAVESVESIRCRQEKPYWTLGTFIGLGGL